MGYDTKTHNSAEISVTFAGLDIASGRADEFCVTEYNKPLYEEQVGPDGELTRIKSNDRSAKITVRVKSTSDGHRNLLSLYGLAQLEPNGGDLAPFQVRDRNRGILESAELAYIKQAPANAYGQEPGDREWVLYTAKLDRIVEG